jgi:hypothetical protein
MVNTPIIIPHIPVKLKPRMKINQIKEKWGIDFAPVVLNWVDGSESTGDFSLNLPRICEKVPRRQCLCRLPGTPSLD